MDLYSADKHICWMCSPLTLNKSLLKEWGERWEKRDICCSHVVLLVKDCFATGD